MLSSALPSLQLSLQCETARARVTAVVNCQTRFEPRLVRRITMGVYAFLELGGRKEGGNNYKDSKDHEGHQGGRKGTKNSVLRGDGRCGQVQCSDVTPKVCTCLS